MAEKMIWTAQEICSITDGQSVGEVEWQVEKVSTDTRTLCAGDLFVALRGENFVGEDFLEKAREKGAIAAIVQEKRAIDMPQIVVKNTKKALAALAAARRKASNAVIVALTGSNGKTSTKEMLARILATQGETLATRGNLNNEIGVPLTLLSLNASHRFAVIEMGANHPGEIAALVDIANPDVVLVTNVSDAHLQGFGSLAGVVEAKGEIYAGSHGKMVINLDLPWAKDWQFQYKKRTISTFSLQKTADVVASSISADGSQFRIQMGDTQADVAWQLQGKHNVANALAACAAASLLGISLADMASALNGLYLKQSRLSAFSVNQHRFYDDTYNANPASFRAGIDVIAGAENSLVIAGAMGELGEQSDDLHRQVGDYAKKVGIKRFWALNAPAYGGENFTSMQALADALNELLAQTERQTVLVKGSRSAAMERLFVQANLEKFRQG